MSAVDNNEIGLIEVDEVCSACEGKDHGYAEHPQSHVSAGGISACVDTGIAPLIAELWLAGINTDWSCHKESARRAQIVFSTAEHHTAFLRLMLAALPNDPILLNRVLDSSHTHVREDEPVGIWANPRDEMWQTTLMLPLDIVIRDHEPTPARICVEFPRFDIVPVTRALASLRDGESLTTSWTQTIDDIADKIAMKGYEATIDNLADGDAVIRFADGEVFRRVVDALVGAELDYELAQTTTFYPVGAVHHCGFVEPVRSMAVYGADRTLGRHIVDRTVKQWWLHVTDGLAVPLMDVL